MEEDTRVIKGFGEDRCQYAPEIIVVAEGFQYKAWDILNAVGNSACRYEATEIKKIGAYGLCIPDFKAGSVVFVRESCVADPMPKILTLDGWRDWYAYEVNE